MAPTCGSPNMQHNTAWHLLPKAFKEESLVLARSMCRFQALMLMVSADLQQTNHPEAQSAQRVNSYPASLAGALSSCLLPGADTTLGCLMISKGHQNMLQLYSEHCRRVAATSSTIQPPRAPRECSTESQNVPLCLNATSAQQSRLLPCTQNPCKTW